MNNEICLLLNVDEEYGQQIDSIMSVEVHLEPQAGVAYDIVIAQIGGEESFPSIMKKANALAKNRIFFEPGLIIDPVICERSNSILVNDNDLIAAIRSIGSREVEL